MCEKLALEGNTQRGTKLYRSPVERTVGRGPSGTLKRFPNEAGIKKKTYSSKRIGRSPPTVDAEYKRRKKEQLEKLKVSAEEGVIRLMYLDESGMDGRGEVCYSWSDLGKQRSIKQPKNRGKRVSVIGVLEPEKSMAYGLTVDSFDSRKYVEFMEQMLEEAASYWQGSGRLTVVVQDNSSVHRSKASGSHHKAWQRKGLVVFYLPPYSPEMNNIEGE